MNNYRVNLPEDYLFSMPALLAFFSPKALYHAARQRVRGWKNTRKPVFFGYTVTAVFGRVTNPSLRYSLKLRSVFVALSIGFFLTVPAKSSVAQSVSGNEYRNWCSQQPGSFDRGACMGFMDGIVAAQDAYAGAGAVGKLFCFPDGVTKRQAMDVALKFMSDNPSQTHEPAVYLLINALTAAFPCKPTPALSPAPKSRGKGS